MASEKKKNFWTDEETIFMLQQLKELNILKCMDGRRTRNAALFQKVAQQLQEAGFFRTADQIRVRWKHLKQTYNAAQKENQTSGHNRVVCPYFELLEELIGSRPLSHATDHGLDIGFSSECVAGLVRVEDDETTMKEQSSEGPSETNQDSLSELASQSSTPRLERATITPPINSPGTRSQQYGRRRRRRQMPDFDLVFQMIEQTYNHWSQQLQLSLEREERREEREERWTNSIIQSIQSNYATVVSALLEDIRSLWPAFAPPMPSQPTTPSHQSQVPYPSMNSGYGSDEQPVYRQF